MQLYLLLNESCNLKCPFCIRGETKESFIDEKSLELILSRDSFFNYNLLLTGGEPTLHPKFNEIIELCSDKFKHVSINTNGVRSDWIDKLQNTKVHVQISIDGVKDDHNRIRSGGLLDVYGFVERTIKKLEFLGISYNIASTVGKYNVDSVLALASDLARFKALKYWKVSPQLPFGCGNTQEALGAFEWNQFVDKIISIAQVRLKIKKYFDFELLESFIRENPGFHNEQKTNCGDVKDKIYVYPDFTVYPCTCLTDFPIGNLLKSNLHEIINSESAKFFSNYSVLENSTCKNCEYLDFCNGGCIGMSYHYFGKLGMGDCRCPKIQNRI